MEKEASRIGRWVRRLLHIVTRPVIAEVPEDVALCEFDCRKGQCIQNEWDSCNRRIRKAAGELFPDPSAGQR